jgi:hypothetical protein
MAGCYRPIPGLEFMEPHWRYMFRLLLTAMLSLLSNACLAHSCLPDMTLDKQFNGSKRVFLVYVLETRLEEELQRKMSERDGSVASESVKLVSAGYRIVEDYKGEKSYKPRLLDFLGIGTGYVGLTPGVYYLVFLGDVQDYETSDMRAVDICTVPVAHDRLDVPRFQKSLDEVRALVKGKS